MFPKLQEEERKRKKRRRGEGVFEERRAAEGLKVCTVNKQISAERHCENKIITIKKNGERALLFCGFWALMESLRAEEFIP